MRVCYLNKLGNFVFRINILSMVKQSHTLYKYGILREHCL